ncbi:MAG: methyltransferase domain-containing protein [Chloroflexota bacterium]
MVDWHLRYLQQAQWTKDLRRYLYEHCEIEKAQRILEVGCGTGALLMEWTSLPTPSINGLDINNDHLRQAEKHAPRACLTLGNAYSLPYPTAFFDVSLCHFLLLWLKDPIRALAEMRRVTRSGGFVLVLAEPDYGGRIDYPDVLHPLGELQSKALLCQGADPLIGRQLGGLMHQVGFHAVETGVLGGQWTQSPDLKEQAMEWSVLENDLQELLAADTLRNLRRADEEAWRRGERILFVPTFYAFARV